MAHPYQAHRDHGKSRSRAGHVLKSGGDVHPDAQKDKGLIKAAIREHEKMEHDVPGYARGGRIGKYARGGKADKKHHTQVNIAVVSPHRGDGSGAGAAPGGAAGLPPIPPRPPMAGPPGMPPGLPPGVGGPPGMPPPGGMPMPPPSAMGPRPPMARGGHVGKIYHGDGIGRGRVKPGGSVDAPGPLKANALRSAASKSIGKFASGGPTKPIALAYQRQGGGDSGPGRVQKAKRYGGSKPHPKI